MNVLAVVFPGQGSQKVGMLSDFSKEEILKETFKEASDVLNYDLWNLIQCFSINELNKTYRAQPAILTASVAIWRIWREKGGRIPKFMAGHSLGEYSALVCSGVIDFRSALKLVELRGFFMQDIMLSGSGVMSAILGLDEKIVTSVCKKVRSSSNCIVSVSSFNAPNHVVISGYQKSVERVNIICKKLGAKFVSILPISVPSHCSLMFPVAEKLKSELKKIKFFMPSSILLVNNVDVCIENNVDNIKEALVRQVYMPVRWKEIIEYLIKCDVNLLIEMGPKRILSTITNRMVNSENVLSVSVNNLNALNIFIKY